MKSVMSEEILEGGLETQRLFPPLLEAAMRVAARGHYDHFRKSASVTEEAEIGVRTLPPGRVPYVTHLMGTMCILARLGASDEVLAAAVLHDYLEDVPNPDGHELIRSAVGERVLALVLEVTEDKRPELDQSSTWKVRKLEQLQRLRKMPIEAVHIKAADVLHNMTSLLTDLDATDNPEVVWDGLNAGPDHQMWYFAAITDAVARRLGAHRLVDELEITLGQLDQKVLEHRPLG